MLSQQSLKDWLSYSPYDGTFRWKAKNSNRVRLGALAGAKTRKGLLIGVQGKRYKAHRLAWLYVYGAWPVGIIDHINGNPHDNRICNLREATNAQNLQNRPKQKNSSSGIKGVSWHRQSGKWKAAIACNGKGHHLGLFATKEDAGAAYANAAQALHGAFMCIGGDRV